MKFQTTLGSELQARARVRTACEWDGSPPTLEASMCTEVCGLDYFPRASLSSDLTASGAVVYWTLTLMQCL